MIRRCTVAAFAALLLGFPEVGAAADQTHIRDPGSGEAATAALAA